MVKMNGESLPAYLDKTDIKLFSEAVNQDELQLMNLDADELKAFKSVDELEIEDPEDEKIAYVVQYP